MKKIWLLFAVLFLISIIFVFLEWQVDGFDFFRFQEQHLYFQSWISIAGILFSIVMAITTFAIYKKTRLQYLRYIPIGFSLTAFAYAITGYHASYCKVCSDLGYCAASHSYPNYLIIITFVIFVLTSIMFSRRLDIVKRARLLQKFSYGLIVATSLLGITLFVSLTYLEIPDRISYVLTTSNLQALLFMMPLIVIILAFIYFRTRYRASWPYLLMALLSSFSFLPQIFHIFTCKDCHVMECSEFYVFSGLIMVIVTGIFIHAVSLQLQENREQD